MTEFKGFPARMQFTPIPNIVISSIMPQITDIDELKVLLCFFKLLYPKKGNIRYVAYGELAECADLKVDFKEAFKDKLNRSLDALVKRGVVLSIKVESSGKSEIVFFLNNDANKTIIEKIKQGEILLPGWKIERSVPISTETLPDIFTLYEQNVGILTPIIADDIKEAIKSYPESWIKDAIKEAVSLNKHNWKYIARILEHWSTEGKDNGTYRGNSKENTDPDKYIRGQYGHIVRR